MTTTRRGFFGAIAAVIAAIGLRKTPAEALPPGCVTIGTRAVVAGDTLWWMDSDRLLVADSAKAPMCYGYYDPVGGWIVREGPADVAFPVPEGHDALGGRR